MENTPADIPIKDTSPIVDTDRVTITKGDIRTGFWVEGAVKENPAYSFEAKVYDLGSKYGIDGGQISKMAVYHHGRRVAHYDRAWDEKPVTRQDRRAVDIITSSFRVRDAQPAPDKAVNAAKDFRRALCRGRGNDDTGRER